MVSARPFFKGSDGCVRSSLDLALLVHAQHHRLVGRVQIDAGHIDQLLSGSFATTYVCGVGTRALWRRSPKRSGGTPGI